MLAMRQEGRRYAYLGSVEKSLESFKGPVVVLEHPEALHELLFGCVGGGVWQKGDRSRAYSVNVGREDGIDLLAIRGNKCEHVG